MFESLDRLINKIGSIGFWILYGLLTMLVIGGISEIGSSSKNLNAYLIYLSIWLWVTVRWLKRHGYISRGQRLTSNKEFKFLPVILTNVIAPVAVSYLTFSLTGQASFSLISIPLTSFLTANIELG
jgi:hypothetical protein